MRFTLNDSGLEQLIHGAQVDKHIEKAADIVASAVEDRAPERTGRFAGSITKTNVERAGTDARITVYSTDFAAHLVEFGSINNPAYAPFRRAASALGLRLRGGQQRR